jgi:hypothetical protein
MTPGPWVKTKNDPQQSRAEPGYSDRTSNDGTTNALAF